MNLSIYYGMLCAGLYIDTKWYNVILTNLKFGKYDLIVMNTI